MDGEFVYFSRFQPTGSRGGGCRRMLQMYTILQDLFPGLQLVTGAYKGLLPKERRRAIEAEIKSGAVPEDPALRNELSKWSEEHRDVVIRYWLLSTAWKDHFPGLARQRIAFLDDPVYFLPLFESLYRLKVPVVALSQNLESLVIQQITQDRSLTLFRQELEIFRRCELVITISREEDVLLNNLGVRTCYHPYFPVAEIRERMERVRQARSGAAKSGILMVANSKNLPTREGFRQAASFWQRHALARSAGPLLLGGFQSEQYFHANDWDGNIQFLGSLDDATLDNWLSRVRAYLCYQPSGAGALTRICEMQLAGVPVLANSHAARSYYGQPGLIEFGTLEELPAALHALDGLPDSFPPPSPPGTRRLEAVLAGLAGR